MLYFSAHKAQVVVSSITLWMTSIILIGCLEVPSLRDQASSSDQGPSGALDETRDQSMSCDEHEARREGECHDASLDLDLPDVETLDAALTCEFDHSACQDALVNDQDLGVVNPTDFINTKSVLLERNGTMTADDLPLYIFDRVEDDQSDTDAWTISFYFKNDGSGAPHQSIMYYRDDREDELHIGVHLYRVGQDGPRHLLLSYGSNSSYLRVQASREIVKEQWHHVMLTYEGEPMRPQVEVADRAKIFIDGVEDELTPVDLGTSYRASNPGFKVGQYHPDLATAAGAQIDEIALWDSDQSMNIEQIYHNGSPRDLRLLTSKPSHWWRMGDGDQDSALNDQVGSVVLQMSANMGDRNLVDDVP